MDRILKCKTCGDTFTETKGTVLYRRHTPEDEIMEILAFIAERIRSNSVDRVKGHKEDTIPAWLRAAGRHAEAIGEVFLAEYQIERGQLDNLWAYVHDKGEKRLPGNRGQWPVLALDHDRHR